MSITRSISVAQTDNRFLISEHEIEDDNMSITRSISIAQTDCRVLKANCYVDYFFY